MAWTGDIVAAQAAISCSIVLLASTLAGCTSGGNQPADASMTDAPSEAYSGLCTFSADAFDQSCTTDTDCVAVSPSYYCSPAQCGCSSITISRSALAQFNAAVARTPLGSGAVEGEDCGCPVFNEGACCVNGTCQNVCGTSDAPSGGYASLCPVFSNQPACPAASDANGCNLSLGSNCAAGALPQGLSCSGTSQCQATIGPVDGCGRVDGWICSCIGGSWSCNDCAVGAALCEGGAGAYELPDGGAD